MALAGRMTKFRITELSGVDRPAQIGAKALIMKRSQDPALEVDPAIRKAAISAGLDALAETRAAKTGETFAKAYAAIITAEPALYEALI